MAPGKRPRSSASIERTNTPRPRKGQVDRALAGLERRASHRREREKIRPQLKFPSGLRLPVVRDREAEKEWKDTSRPPLAAFAMAFKGKKQHGDILESTLHYIRQIYIEHIPLVKITPADLDKKISKHFTVRELVRIDPDDKPRMEAKGTWKRHEKYMIRDAAGNYYWAVARIDPNLCRTLDLIRERFGAPITTDEGVRSFTFNRDCYLAKGQRPTDSTHASGRAVDLKRNEDSSDAKLERTILRVLQGIGGGFGKYPITPTFHVDVLIRAPNWEIDPKTGKVHLRTRGW